MSATRETDARRMSAPATGPAEGATGPNTAGAGHATASTGAASGRRPSELRAPTRPPAVSSDTIVSIVWELNEVFRNQTVNVYLALGRIIVDRLYQGNLSRWRTRGIKDISFRRLAAQSGRELMVSASGLYRAVALYELFDRVGVSNWKHLGVSHLRGVLGLPDPDQRRLLTAAESEKWTVEQLEKETAKLRRPSGTRRGRPPLPPIVKTVHRLESILERPDESLAGLDTLGDKDDPRLLDLLQRVAQLKEQLDLLVARLRVSTEQ